MREQNIYEVYHRYAKFYNIYFGKILNPGRVKAIEVANLQPDEQVLEVGVGTGLSLPHYPSDVEVSGIDLSPEMLKKAQRLVQTENLTNIKKLEIMDAENMDFADNSFDCVMAMHIVTVVSHPDKFAQEMKRVCRPGGRIIIVNYFHNNERPIGKVSEILAPYAKYIGFKPDFTLEQLLEVSGLKIEKRIPVNMFSIWDVLLVKNDKN
jgi:phosphatidylethanolamine/phosphatidyl-N-methylethanolamine N-methyltransferase